MNARLLLLGGTIVGMAALSACGGGGGSGSSPAPVACMLPSGDQVALAYPAPGAVGVPDSPGQIVIADSTGLQNWQVVLLYPNGTLNYEALVVTIPQNQVPAPFATPSFANPVYQSSGLTTGLPSGTQVSVLLNDQGSICNQFPTLGSFTTQ